MGTEPEGVADDPQAALARTTLGAPEDALLLAAIQRGDELAVAALYDRYGGAAYGLAYRITGDGPSSEDVVQDAFVALWKQARRFDPQRGQVRSWLMTIVHHRAIDLVRRRSGRAERALPDGPDEFIGTRDRPEEIAEWTLEAEAVRGAVRLLPEDQRRAVELAYFEGLTYVEIAESVGVPLGTVKSRLRLALEKLRVSLRGVVFE
ncbi:MAG TPA: sigma-70 family RNA polymerase sigma factor [Dehalococcoidia bacterium]|nr:sigma-70 family RNA polymerase sigma factor [Dehalococcoidia bacterium]